VVEPNDPTIRTETNSFELPPAKGEITLVDADNVSELINLLKNEAKVI
jgi:electron transfer flavoprotein beta subunit